MGSASQLFPLKCDKRKNKWNQSPTAKWIKHICGWSYFSIQSSWQSPLFLFGLYLMSIFHHLSLLLITFLDPFFHVLCRSSFTHRHSFSFKVKICEYVCGFVTFPCSLCHEEVIFFELLQSGCKSLCTLYSKKQWLPGYCACQMIHDPGDEAISVVLPHCAFVTQWKQLPETGVVTACEASPQVASKIIRKYTNRTRKKKKQNLTRVFGTKASCNFQEDLCVKHTQAWQ